MSQTAHALLSPSGAERWLNCTPSARLEQEFPDSSGDAAKEGTLAHSLGELLIKYKLNLVSKQKYQQELKKIEENRFYDNSMLEYCDNYATHVLECYAEAKVKTPDALIFLEQRLNLTEYVPEGFGTGDAIIIADGMLDLDDFKYGKGVPVSAVNNKQMMLYALGALREFAHIYDIQRVRMTIYQPRIDNISTWELSVEDLLAWAEQELKPKAALAFDGAGEYQPGLHCRFCKAKALCKANADYNLELANYDFKVPALLNDNEVADILSRVDHFKQWANAVEEHALTEAVNNGKKWPGYKLVEGRSNRKYTSEKDVANKLLAEGIAEDIIYTKSIQGITALEKALGKATFNTYLADLIVKPVGKPALVPETDKRPELCSLESAQQDFND